MSRHSKLKIYIQNPVSDCHWTTRRSAERYVDRGQAEWADTEKTAIRFVEERRPAPIVEAMAAATAATAESSDTGSMRRIHSPNLAVTPAEWGWKDNEPGPDPHGAYTPWPTYEQVRATTRRMAEWAA